MNILIAARLAFARILATKTRSGLTMLGIIIGVMSLIALVSVAQGATSGIQDQFKGLGARNLTITGTTPQSITVEDAQAIAQEPGIDIVSETVSGRATLSSNQASTKAQIVGVDADYKTVVDPDIFVGTFLPDVADVGDARLIVLSTTLATDLELDAYSVGSTIAVGSTEFTIVGILDDADGFGSRGTAYIPIETAFKYVAVPPYLSSITVQTVNEKIVPEVTSNLTALLKSRHNITADREADFVITDASQILDAIGTVEQFLSLLLGGIASISLVVGGIGIMNIMLVSVRERTREIGIRRAIGAQQSQILTQFLIEAVVLSLVGGIIGVIIGEIVAYFLSSLGEWNFALSPGMIFASLGFSMFVGVVFGVWPARTASKLKPVEALRFE
uniref:Putative ABC transporter substrate-binding protein n=1 Tax=uncultured Actinomycetes bacterium TaxID=152507 RepID=A0A2R4S923_9ACTN|nr:putative ABC transporter substrate-binding protein [uncultured Actinomycetes bacterium]